MGQLFDEHPLLILVSGLIAGCLVAFYWQLQVPLWSILGLFMLLIVAIGVRIKGVFVVVLGLFCVTWSVFAFEPFHASCSPAQSLGVPPLAGMLVVEGTVIRRPVALPQGQRFELQLERIVVPNGEMLVGGRLLVTIAKGEGSWLSGDRIRLRGSLGRPRRLGLPGEFDYPRYLALHRIDATFWVADARQVLLIRSAAVSWQRLLDGAAQRCDQLIRFVVPGPDTAAVVMALVTGSQSALSPELKTAYARAGVSHILSISGFHVAVIAATLAQLLQWVGLRWQWLALRFNVRQVALLATLPAMIGYLVFTGAAPATTRSVIMLAAVVLALWAERESQVLDALLLAAFLLLVYDPVVLFDISFQLSFLSLWGIVVLTPLLVYPFKDRLSGWRRQLALFFAASLAAILATAVPTLVTFHQASFTGLLANLVVVPLLGYGAVIVGAGAAMFAVVAPSLASVLFGLAGRMVAFSNRFVVWVADLPMVRSYEAGWPDLVALVLVLSVLSFVSSVRWRGILLGSVCALIMAVHIWPEKPSEGRLRLTFLSVGQAEATLLQFPDRTTMLIDGGGYLRDTGLDFGDRYLVPALHALGVKRIDRLVLTHPHPDHLGGLPAVAEQFQIGEFWQGTWNVAAGGDADRLQSTLLRRGVPIRQLNPGIWRESFGGCQLVMIAPELDDTTTVREKNDDNEASLVLQVTHGQFNALFMADAGIAAEQRMLEQQVVQPVTLLKVGHHGSRTATGEAFVRTVRPRLALISVGAGNRFGLPAPETLARLQRAGVEVYRTDQHGTVLVESDGKNYTVTTGL